jgi:hypothetical protein
MCTRWAAADWHLISQSRQQLDRHIALGIEAMVPVS